MLLALVVCGVAGCNGIVRFGELDPPPGELMVVDIDIEGNDEVSDRALIEGLATITDWAAFQEPLPLLDRSELPTDAERVEATLARHGFFDARVVDIQLVPRSEDSVEVVFVVEEGEPTHIATLDFEGLDDVELRGDSDAARRLREVAGELTGLAELEPDAVWTEEAHEATEAAIAEALQELGFVHAEVQGRAFVDRDDHRAAVVFQIAHGPLVRIAGTRTSGNRKVEDERILRRADVEPGTIATPDALERIEERVYDLGNFVFVRAHLESQGVLEQIDGDEADPDTLMEIREVGVDEVDEGVEDDDPYDRFAELRAASGEVFEPLVIDLQELPFHELTGGVGGSLGANRSDVHLSLGYENLDFLGGLRKLDIELRPELVFLSESFGGTEAMAPGGRARVVFRQPSFLEEMLELRATGTYDLLVDYGYNLHHVSAQPRLSRRVLRYLEFYVAYNVDYYQYFAISDAFDEPSRRLLGFAFRTSYLTSGLEQGITFDLRDDVLDTRNGFYAATSVNEALTALGSDFEYFRVLGDVRGYLTFWEPLTLAARFKTGRIFTLTDAQDVPLAARFRGGGPHDMRGFGFNRMGPSLCLEDGVPEGTVLDDGVECPGGVQDQVFVGGNLMLEASFETRWRLPVSLFDFPLGLVAFVDVGEVFDTLDEFSMRELHVAAGPGLRWLTPIGPVRFDLGILLTGPIAPSPELHFSIGQAF